MHFRDGAPDVTDWFVNMPPSPPPSPQAKPRPGWSMGKTNTIGDHMGQ